MRHGWPLDRRGSLKPPSTNAARTSTNHLAKDNLKTQNIYLVSSLLTPNVCLRLCTMPKTEAEAKPKDALPSEEEVRPPDPHDDRHLFGGDIGSAVVIVFSHLFIYGMASSLFGYNIEDYLPSLRHYVVLIIYQFWQFAFVLVVPGMYLRGQTKLGYVCNAYSCFYYTLIVIALLHNTGVFDIRELTLEWPRYLTASVVLGNLYSVMLHVWYGLFPRKGEEHLKANLLSAGDFFMGAVTHPRFFGGIVDLKLVAETRVSWTLLLVMTVSAWLVCADRNDGLYFNPVLFMVLAHWLYGNACAKGEHFIPYTWDITTERFGWMLCFWNFSGVPFLYCFQSMYIVENFSIDPAQSSVPLSVWYYAVLTIALLFVYYVWDEANFQKCTFKMEFSPGGFDETDLPKMKSVKHRFPTFSECKAPVSRLECERGVLLTDGWYKYARKIHYTADTLMALLWGLSCGFSSLWPYFYFGFFAAMISHRCYRDECRCSVKYGKTWEEYVKRVPYRFIPGVF